jgi:hypothetical protein
VSRCTALDKAGKRRRGEKQENVAEERGGKEEMFRGRRGEIKA